MSLANSNTVTIRPTCKQKRSVQWSAIMDTPSTKDKLPYSSRMLGKTSDLGPPYVNGDYHGDKDFDSRQFNDERSRQT